MEETIKMSKHKYKYWLWLMLWLPSVVLGASLVSDTGPMEVYQTKEDFEIVKLNLQTTITDRGVNINNTLHISEMLERTGKDLGFKPLYTKAESFEFCSALFAQRMMELHPANIAACPLTIAIYCTVANPNQVYIAFRKPVLAGSQSLILTQEIETWLRAIVRDTLAN